VAVVVEDLQTLQVLLEQEEQVVVDQVRNHLQEQQAQVLLILAEVVVEKMEQLVAVMAEQVDQG
jgi:hypothetical protein